jgi:hypothetical protein
MATKGHIQGSRGSHKNMNIEEMDKELKETREDIDILVLQWNRMQKES